MIIRVGEKVINKEVLNFGTHNGIFHCDEVVGIAILGILFKSIDSHVVRTRDLNELKKVNIAIDVGGDVFDHHSKAFNIRRATGEKYASAGLMWREFGKRVIKCTAAELGICIDDKETQRIKEEIDKEIMLPIDDEDNPENVEKEFKEHTFSFIPKFLPTFLEEQEFNIAFMKAVHITTEFLEVIIKEKVVETAERPYLQSIVSNAVGGILELPTQTINWLEEVLKYNESHNNSIKFVIFPYPAGGFAAQCVPPSIEKRMSQLVPFPKEWAGENEETLPKISGIKGAISCHNGRFFAKASTKKAIVDMCRIAMKTK